MRLLSLIGSMPGTWRLKLTESKYAKPNAVKCDSLEVTFNKSKRICFLQLSL